MKETTEKVLCPTCKKPISPRGLLGHLRMAHSMTTEEAHEIIGSDSKPVDEEIDETVDGEKDRIKKVFELMDELKKIEEREEEIEKNKTAYLLTDEEKEDLQGGLKNLRDDVFSELEDLGIEFKDEDNPGEEDEEEDQDNPGEEDEDNPGEEDEEEDQDNPEKKKSWWRSFFFGDDDEEGDQDNPKSDDDEEDE